MTLVTEAVESLLAVNVPLALAFPGWAARADLLRQGVEVFKPSLDLCLVVRFSGVRHCWHAGAPLFNLEFDIFDLEWYLAIPCTT